MSEVSALSAVDGELDKLIKVFNDFEAELFSTCIDAHGVCWWDIVRYDLFYAIAIDKGLKGSSFGTKHSLFSRLPNYARVIFQLFFDLFTVLKLSDSDLDTVFVTRRELPPIVHGISNNDKKCLVVCGPSIDPGRHRAISQNSIDGFVKIFCRFIQIPKKIWVDMSEIDVKLRSHFNCSINFKEIMRVKFRQHLASMLAWSFVVSRPKIISNLVYVNDNKLKGLVHLARARQVNVQEVQHGYMGRAHEAFTYPTLSTQLSTLPHELVMIRDTGDIVYPVPKSLWENHESSVQKEHEGVDRNIDVLIASSPRMIDELQEVVRILSIAQFKVAVKIHPTQTEIELGLENYKSIELISAQSDFCMAARRAHVFIPINSLSTTGFEAIDVGARLLLIFYEGVKLSSIFDNLPNVSVDNIDEIPHAVLEFLPSDRRREITVLQKISNEW